MLKKILITCIFVLSLTGCRNDVNVSSTQVAYDYSKDINKAVRFNPGSNYYRTWPFEAEHKLLTFDYGVFEILYNYSFTLPNKAQKVTIKGTSSIYVQLKRNPLDKDRTLSFNNDDYIKYWAENVPATNGQINASSVYIKLMGEANDDAFRNSFLENKSYKTFDDIEKNMKSIRDDIKQKLNDNASKYKLEIVAIKVSDPIVPAPIEDSRNKMLKLEQDQLNQIKELEISANLASKRMAVAVREALNDVMLDQIAGQTNKQYLLIKFLNRAVDEKSPLTLSLTPDFMRYLNEDNTSNNNTNSNNVNHNQTISKLKDMSDQELQAFFKKAQ